MPLFEFKLPPDPRFEQTQYVVEATDFEQFALWKECMLYKEYGDFSWRNRGGQSYCIGTIGTDPVCVVCTWVLINDVLVLFYEATSKVVNHDWVKDWVLKATIYPMFQDRVAHCDAMNFNHCIAMVRSL